MMRCNRGVSISIWMVIWVLCLAACVGSPATQIPSSTLAATSTPAATTTVTPVPTETPASPTPEMAFTSMSPDGTWAAQGAAMSAADAGTRHVWLDVSKTDGSVEWRLVDEWAEQALGQTTPRPFAWSRDGRYLYFTNFGVPDGCPGFVNGSDLQRVDLSDGSLTEVVPGVGFWLALAPDESKLAYAGYGGRGLVVRDLATGEEREVTLESDVEGAKLGHIIWSPDGTKLMLTAGFNLCGPPEGRMHSIIRVDLSEGSHSTLIDRDSRLFSTQAWHAPGYVLLADKDEHHWEMNVDTGEATQIESTGCPSTSASLDERVSHADWVFSGRVEKIEFLDAKKPESGMGLHHYEPRIIVRFSVDELWKGTPGTEEITLHTRYNAWSFNNARWLSSCSGFPFEEGEAYLVFAYKHNEYSRPFDAPNPFEDLPEDALDTSIWAGTERLEDATEDVLLLSSVLPTNTPTLVSPTSAPPLTPLATTSEVKGVELVGHIGGPPLAVFGQGNYLYLGLGTELAILDVSDATHPKRVGYVVLPDIVQDIYVAGDHAYVADLKSGLWLVDISSPAHPVAVGHYDTPGDAWGVVVTGRLAYVADGESGLRVIDVSDPTAPAEVGFYDTTLHFARDVIEAGNHVYIVTSSGPVLMMDVSEPTAPVEVGRYEAPEYVWDVEEGGNYAYVVVDRGPHGEFDGLRILDVSNPSVPTEIGSYSTGDAFSGFGAQEVAVVGNYAYLIGSGGLRVVDVSDATGPALVGAYDTPWFTEWTNRRAGKGNPSAGTPNAPSWNGPRVVVMNNYAYVTDSQAGLHVIDVSNAAAPLEIGLYRTPSRPSDVALAGDYAYVHDLSRGLHVLNVSDPSNPVGIGFYEIYPSGADANGMVALHQNYEAGFIDPPGASTVAVQGDYVYIIDKVALALRVIDVSDPAAPVAVGFWDGLGYPLSLAVVDNLAYIFGGNSRMFGDSIQWVVDVSDPTTPTEVGSYGSNEAGIGGVETAVAGDYAYFSEAGQDVEVEDAYAYITILDASYSDGIQVCVQCGLQVVDISDPTAPAEIDFYSLPYPKGVTVANGYAYVSSPAGLYILRYSSWVE